MKKKYIPFGTSILLYGALFIVVLTISIIILITSFSTLKVILFPIISLICLYFFLSPVIMYQIDVSDNILSMKKDFGIFKEDRIQSACKVDLNEVVSYKVVLSERDSEGRPYSSGSGKKKYIEFVMKGLDETGGEVKKRLFVSNYSSSQLFKILKYIKERSGIDISNE